VLRADRGAKDGDVVRLLTREGRPVGYGFWHSGSRIAVRVLSHDPDVVPDEAWLRSRVREADRLRRDTLRLPDSTNAWRVIHGEADGLSGLVVDRFADVGSVEVFSLGWQRRLDELEQALADEAGLKQVAFRADAKSVTLEGLDLPRPARIEPVEAVENGVRYRVDPTGGHKTGFFLDQRDNRALLAGLARGRHVFDGMTYTGGFALACAKGGAASVRGMDLDEEAVAYAQRNAEHNGLEVVFEHGDVFDALRRLAAEDPERRPGIVIVDPPKWARDRKGLGAALYRYRDLNRLALEAVAPGGLVCTCSCSGLVSESMLIDVVREAALDVRRSVRILVASGAAPDHPVASIFPEGRYLKCLLLSVGAPGSGPGGGDRTRSPDEARRQGSR
jgi:23S rRNA (cytosine1962-C5)-methyltransferase